MIVISVVNCLLYFMMFCQDRGQFHGGRGGRGGPRSNGFRGRRWV